MLSKKDIAIRENVKKLKTVNTFFKQVKIDENDCHVWQNSTESKGYGYFGVYSKELGTDINVRAHRFSYAIYYGFDALPRGAEGGNRMVLNHLCFNKRCVNPLHLEVITSNENISAEKRKPKNG